MPVFIQFFAFGTIEYHGNPLEFRMHSQFGFPIKEGVFAHPVIRKSDSHDLFKIGNIFGRSILVANLLSN